MIFLLVFRVTASNKQEHPAGSKRESARLLAGNRTFPCLVDSCRTSMKVRWCSVLHPGPEKARCPHGVCSPFRFQRDSPCADAHVFRRKITGHRLGKLRFPIHKILTADGIPGGLPCIHTTAERFGVPVSLGNVFCRQTGGARLPGSSAVENEFLLLAQGGQPFTERL